MENMIFCQSCGVPIGGEIGFGTNADGSENKDYCSYCFVNGAFDPSVSTMEEMIVLCVPHVVEAGTCPDEASARAMLEEHLPKLKRWASA